VNNNPDCERVRHGLMAASDGEAAVGEPNPGLDVRQHLESCAACEQWLSGLESMGQRLQRVSYPNAPVDLWPALERTLRPSDARHLHRRRLYVMAGLLLGWRSLQLFVELPLPLLHSIIPLAIGLAVLWQLARDPLAIQTLAPELEK
jgi:predicted anti-sigma-YlaC factor YlaD